MDPCNAGKEDPNITKKRESNPSSPIRKNNRRSKTFGPPDHCNEHSDCLIATSNYEIAYACDEQKNDTTDMKQIELNCENYPSRVLDSKQKSLLDN